MTLAERMQKMDFVLTGGPHRCLTCKKPLVFSVHEINNEFFVGPTCECTPSLRKKYATHDDAVHALLTRSYKKDNND